LRYGTTPRSALCWRILLYNEQTGSQLAITLKTPQRAILRQLECSMADFTQPYDELAAHYDQIFEDWKASIARQATGTGMNGSISSHNLSGKRSIAIE
jgi:hypothetical protein